MHRIIPTDRDMDLLACLWRWKLLSTAALTERYFADRSPITAYTRLWHLRTASYIQLISDSGGRRYAWCLAQKGFAAIQSQLPELLEFGFKSENVEHDHLVSAVHLGDWLRQNPRGAELFTEQELRRYHLDHYPDWVPRTSEHRPDGYWRVLRNGKFITIALEVEINRKRDRFYQQLAHFYERHPQVDRVLWVVTSQLFAESVSRLLQKEIDARAVIHNFALRKDFEKNGWNASIAIGAEQGKPLSFLLDHTPQTSSIPVWTRFLLDTRKCPHKSKGYQSLRTACFSDRHVLPPKIT